MGKMLPGLVVSFVNQKGGSGKSTLTAIYANWLFTTGKKFNLRIAVVDCDNQQATLASLRERELGETSKKRNELYTIIRMPSEAFADRLEDLQNSYDIILVDLPGNMEQNGVMAIYHLIDVSFIPFKLTGGDIDGTIKFWDRYSKVIEEREKLGFKTIVKGIANDVTVNTAEFKDFNADGGVKDNLPFEVLDVYVRHRAEFGRYSTTDQKDDKQLYDVFDKLTETITSYIE